MSIRVEEERGCQVYCGWGRSTHHVVLEPARSSFPITGIIHLFSGDSRPRRTSVDSGHWNTELIHLPRVLLSVLFWEVQPPKPGGNPWKGGILIFTTHLSGPIECFPTTKNYTNGLLSIKTASHATCFRYTQHKFETGYTVCASPTTPRQSKDSWILVTTTTWELVLLIITTLCWADCPRSWNVIN